MAHTSLRIVASGTLLITSAAWGAVLAQSPASDQGSSPGNLISTPLTTQHIGGSAPQPQQENPVKLDDLATIERGMRYFNQFNCVGCHAANGAGGMGPALSNRKFIYGGSPDNIYLTIQQGRPNGMPAWNGMLPNEVIWDLVAYIRSLSEDPQKTWAKTTAPGGFAIEQVPAQTKSTATPWKFTQPFSYGQAPFQKVKSPSEIGVPQSTPNAQQAPGTALPQAANGVSPNRSPAAADPKPEPKP